MLHHGPVGTPQWDRHRGGLSGCTAAAVVFPLPCLSRVPGGASALALSGKRREMKFEQSLIAIRILVLSFKTSMGDFLQLLCSVVKHELRNRCLTPEHGVLLKE